MTGLLQRLGALATGTARTVRSDARLPFSAERMAPLPPAGDDAGSAAVALWPQTPQTPQTTQPAPADAAGIAPEPCVAAAEPAARLSRASGSPLLGGPHDPPAIAPTAPAWRQPAGAPPRVAATARMDPDAPVTAPWVGATGMSPHVDAVRNAAPNTVPHATKADATRPEAPAPLLPSSAGSHAQPSAAVLRAASAAAAVQQGTQAAPPQDTEVHIHIGRIEVTAVHEAPRPRARPRERAQPMSLDAYLARRGNTG